MKNPNFPFFFLAMATNILLHNPSINQSYLVKSIMAYALHGHTRYIYNKDPLPSPTHQKKGPGQTSSSNYYGIFHQFPHRKCAKLLIHQLYDNIFQLFIRIFECILSYTCVLDVWHISYEGTGDVAYQFDAVSQVLSTLHILLFMT